MQTLHTTHPKQGIRRRRMLGLDCGGLRHQMGVRGGKLEGGQLGHLAGFGVFRGEGDEDRKRAVFELVSGVFRGLPFLALAVLVQQVDGEFAGPGGAADELADCWARRAICSFSSVALLIGGVGVAGLVIGVSLG